MIRIFLLILALFTTGATAQTVTPGTFDAPAGHVVLVAPSPPPTVDLRPIIDGVVWPLMETALPGALLWLMYLVSNWLGIKYDAEQRAVISQVMSVAVGQFLAETKGKLPSEIDVDVRSQALKRAADYAIAHGPDAMKALGVDYKDVPAMIEARVHVMEQQAEKGAST